MRGVILIGAMAALCTACGSSAAVDEGTVQAPPPASGGSVVTPGGGGSTGGSGTTVPTMQLQAWLVRDGLIWPVQVTLPKSQAVGGAAIQAMLAGPNPAQQRAGLSTTVPPGTRQLGLKVQGGTATIDLSSEFEAPGDASSVTSRLAQVVYTLTQFPTVKRVAFLIDGQPVTAFPGSGTPLSRPQTRQDYVDAVPAIAVVTPSDHSVVSSPITVSGVADVFEANVSIEVLDAGGHLVGKTVTTATCGTGCVGTFTAKVPYDVSTRQRGTVVVHDDDAAGTGTYPHEVRIPVTLMP
jgi:sporulation and spore germination protein/immunoglobulin-like protein involved in spore germination